MSAVILVHGGAGPMRTMDAAREAAYRAGLAGAARAGRDVLARGGSAVEAVVVASRLLEADGTFNAGAGACLDEDGEPSLDAALMRGRDRAAGAVGACRATRHPIDVCRSLLDEGRHVLLVGDGADRLARRLGLPALDPIDLDRRATWARLSGRGATALTDLASTGRPDDGGAGARAPAGEPAAGRGTSVSRRAGGGTDQDGGDTVGAVALDAQGRLAAAVTTGGLWLKARGRVGDSALPGAGLFACDELGGAASATGIGERIIRAGACRVACDHARLGAERAARLALDDLHDRFGPDSGGLIVVDRLGGIGAPFDTAGMGRAVARVGPDAVTVAIWRDERFDA